MKIISDNKDVKYVVTNKKVKDRNFGFTDFVDAREWQKDDINIYGKENIDLIKIEHITSYDVVSEFDLIDGRIRKRKD